MIEIKDKNEFAQIGIDFETAKARLQANPNWGPQVLLGSGEYKWVVVIADIYSARFKVFTHILEESPDAMTVVGVTGKNSNLAYRVERDGQAGIRVTPLAFLDMAFKITTFLSLLLLFILPALLTPLVWRLLEARVQRTSRLHLASFCRYLPQEKEWELLFQERGKS